jgi:hypothetical protein
MNGFAAVGMDEDAFGEKKGLQGLRTFDAFRMCHLFLAALVEGRVNLVGDWRVLSKF